MVTGYRQAVERFQQAAKGRDPDAAFHPLFEALNWAVSLDERVSAHWAPEGQPLGWAWRERVATGDVVAAVRFARNRIHHQWSDALRLDNGGFMLPMTFPLVFFEWVWRDGADLPAAERPDRKGEVAYDRRLTGRAARVTLSELLDAFAEIERLLEPSRPSEHHADQQGS